MNVPSDRLEIRLVRASNDEPERSSPYQKELRIFAAHVPLAQQRAMAFDSIDSLGYPIGEFILHSDALAALAIHQIGKALTAYVKARAGRKVRVKTKDFDITAGSAAEVAVLMKSVSEHAKRERALADAAPLPPKKAKPKEDDEGS